MLILQRAAVDLEVPGDFSRITNILIEANPEDRCAFQHVEGE